MFETHSLLAVLAVQYVRYQCTSCPCYVSHADCILWCCVLLCCAVLQLTPTTHITATACEQCYLPQHTVTVHTDYGPVDLHLSLAGSRVCKSTPNWQHCEQAAAGQDGVDATAVAAAAIQQLQAGLADGSIDLGTQYLY